jgi:sulfonate transport system substrate-binding protein
MRRRDFLKTTGLLAAGGVGLSLAACGEAPGPAAAATASSDLPNAIRIGAMGTWGSSIANNIWGVVQTRGYAEEEFAPDGVKIEWTVIDGGGNSVNEAVANGLLDFSQYGGLPEIIGKARGLPTRILASSGYMYSYLAVRSDLPVHTPADLKGRTVGIGLGSYGHLATGILLKEHGIALKDVNQVKMNGTDATAALATGRIDALLGGPTLFPLEAKGLIRIIYVTRGRKTRASGFSGVMATESFADRYPSATRRLLKAYIRGAHWVSLPENRESFMELGARTSTTPIALLRRDFAGQELKERFNPLADDYFVARYRQGIAFSLESGIIRNPIDVDRWIDRHTVLGAIADLGLQGYWTAWDADGNPLPDGGRPA